MEQTLLSQCGAGCLFRDLLKDNLSRHEPCCTIIRFVTLGWKKTVSKTHSAGVFPHGLGHLLGFAGSRWVRHQVDQAGTLRLTNDDAPFLRLPLKLRKDMVITIETGAVFHFLCCCKMQAETLKDHGWIDAHSTIHALW